METSAKVIGGGRFKLDSSFNVAWRAPPRDDGHPAPPPNTFTRVSILRPRVCRSLRRLDGWPVSRSTIGRSCRVPRNVKVVQTFKQLVKSSQLACHGAWRPETNSVSTPAARRRGGAKTAFESHLCAASVLCCPSGFLPKYSDGNETSLTIWKASSRDELRIVYTKS